MSYQLAPLQAQEVSRLLQRLYALQDRQLSEQKLELLMEEISNTGYPFHAIEKGLDSMMTQDVKTLKFCYILDAIRKFVTTDVFKATEHCDHCGSTGWVSMIDNEGRSWALVCNCDLGKRISEVQPYSRWNGYVKQRNSYGFEMVLHSSCKGGLSEYKSQPAIYARGCAPDKDSPGDIQPASGNEGGDQVCCGHAVGEVAGGVINPVDIAWEE